MRTESGNVEGHAALLKLSNGAHLGRTGHGASRKIVHSHPTHLRAQQRPGITSATSQSTPRAATQSQGSKSRRRSSWSTLIWYPGLKDRFNSSTNNASSPALDKNKARERLEKTKSDKSVTEKTEKIPKLAKVVEAARRRAKGCGYRPTLESLLPTSAKEFDFDSDESDEEEKEKEAKAQSLKTLQVENYNKMCKLEGITPCGKFKRQMTDCVVDVSNSLLGTKDIKSICVALASNLTIKELDLSGNDLSLKGACYVAEALRENSTVEDLSLCQCDIDLQGLRSLADLFLEMKPMKRIDFSKNKFEGKHAEILSEVIQKNDYIEELVLSGNQFDEAAGVSIGKALGSNVGIKKLDLSWNHLRREGATAVCMALKFNQTIEELDLSWNGLAEEGSRALGTSLPCNHTLKELDISCNRIGIVCLRELLKGLEKNDHLQVLRIDQNPMTTEGAIALIKCLGKSKVSELTKLYMTDIPINPDFLDQLDELLKIRTVQVYHRDPNKKKITPIIRQRTLKDYDPAMILFEYMKQENLRLIDLFRTFDTDSSQTVSKDELKDGFMTINMPLTEDALDSLFERLDLNENEEIEYDEVKSGYRKTLAKTRGKDENHEAAMAGLKKLIQKALKEKRQNMKTMATKKVYERRQSQRAVFQFGKNEYKVSYRKTMKKMRSSANSDDQNDVYAIKQLKSLVKKALDDRRQEKLLQLKGKRRQRQASLTAVFKVAGEKFLQRMASHDE